MLMVRRLIFNSTTTNPRRIPMAARTDHTESAAEPVARPRRWRWLLPALVTLVWLFVGGPLGQFAGQLSQVQENDSSSFLPASAESTRVNELAADFRSDDVLPAVVVYEFDRPVTAQDVAAVAEQAAEIDALDFVAQVVGPIPSQDGQALQLIVPIDAAEGVEISEDVLEVRAIVGSDGSIEINGATSFVTGPAGFLADFGEAFGEIDGLLLGVTLLVVLIILLVVYRSPILPFVVLFTAILALGAAAAVVYLLAENDVLTLNGQSQGILFILVVGAATDYALLLVARYREELRRHPSKYDAMRVTLKGTYEAILASGGTVVLGVMALALSELNSVQGLGPVAAVGIVFSMLAALTFLPAVLTLLGRGAFWPFRPGYGSAPTEVRGVWGRVARFVDRRPRPIWVLVTLVLVALAAFLPTFKADGVAQSDFFLATVEATEGQEALARHFPAGSGSPATVIGPTEELPAMVSTLEGVDGVAAVVPVSDPATGEPVVVDGRVQVDVTLVDAADSDAAEQTVTAMRVALDDVSAEALVGGPTAVQLDTQTASQRDLRVIIPVVLVVILLVLMLLLRAVLLPVLLMGTVVLSFAATLGLGAIVFNTVFDFPGADPSVPLFAFVFLAALGIDYNIFLMTRAREETIRLGTRRGMLKALAVTGGVITSAGIVLAATFGALFVLPILFLAQIAFLVSVGVLIDALVVRSLLVPALVIDVGPKVWWPSRLTRRTEPEPGTGAAGGGRPDGQGEADRRQPELVG
jgi:RND superfamily putative drug exporter